MKPILRNALIVIEGILTAVPFLLSWWVSAIWYAVVSGRDMARLNADEKRAAIDDLLT